MRNTILFYFLVTLGFPIHSLADSPKVAVDIAPLHSLVSQVMDGVNQPDLIIPAEASPHHYTLRPSQARALADSEIIFWVGEELTPWLEKAMDNVASSAKKVSMLDLESTTTYSFREGATFEKHEHHDDHEVVENAHQEHDEHEIGLIDRFLSLFSSENHDYEEHDHEKHDDHDEHMHEGVDPHAWLDPQNAKIWITEITAILSKHDPDNSKTYQSNASKASAELDNLIKQTQDTVSNLGDLKFIVFHDAYQYFEKRFGIAATGSISLGDAEDPSPSRVEAIRDTVKNLKVTCVFAEPQYDAGLVENVFEGSNIASISVMDPLGAEIKTGKMHYSELIQKMAMSLSQCNK